MKTLKELIQQEQEKHNQNKFTALSELIAEVATTTAKAAADVACDGHVFEVGSRLKTFLGEEGV